MVFLTQRIVMVARNSFAPLLCIVLLLATSGVSAMERQQILVLASYHAGLSWTDGQLAGLREGLSKSDLPVDLHIEFLDTKRTPPTLAYFAKVSDLLNEKYRQTKIALVVAQDDDALDFALQQRLPGRRLNGSTAFRLYSAA